MGNWGGGLSVRTPYTGGYAPCPDSVPWPRPGWRLGEGTRLRSRASPVIQDTVRRCLLQTGRGCSPGTECRGPDLRLPAPDPRRDLRGEGLPAGSSRGGPGPTNPRPPHMHLPRTGQPGAGSGKTREPNRRDPTVSWARLEGWEAHSGRGREGRGMRRPGRGPAGRGLGVQGWRWENWEARSPPGQDPCPAFTWLRDTQFGKCGGPSGWQGG